MITEGYQVELAGTQWWITEATPERLLSIQKSKDEDVSEPDDGRCLFDSQTILINSELHSHRKALALSHEMLHVICDSIGLDEDEEIIRKLEHGVLNMIKVFPEEYIK